MGIIKLRFDYPAFLPFFFKNKVEFLTSSLNLRRVLSILQALSTKARLRPNL